MITKRIVSHIDEHHLLTGDLTLPDPAYGMVIFAHGSGSSRLSPRNQYVARCLNEQGLATLLFDLLTPEEDRLYSNRFNIELLAKRLVHMTKWLIGQREFRYLAIGFFGASTGAAAALSASAQFNGELTAVVSRGGRPDLAGEEALQMVSSPTLLIVGGEDCDVLELNRVAFSKMHCERELYVVPEAGHLFEEPGKLQIVADLAAEWFLRHFAERSETLTVKDRPEL
jgi:predicted alpha/beta-hydrolase family hydrolase